MAEPVRTCVGCRRRAPQSELARLTLASDGSLILSRTAPGRGAWLCRGSPRCLELAVERNALARAFRRPVAPASVRVLLVATLDVTSGGRDRRLPTSGGGFRSR